MHITRHHSCFYLDRLSLGISTFHIYPYSSLLKSITLGRLVVHTSSRTYVFPAKTSQHLVPRESDLDGQMLNAELTVRSPIFWLRLASMGDLGFAEAYMYGEVECADLFEIFEVSTDHF